MAACSLLAMAGWLAEDEDGEGEEECEEDSGMRIRKRMRMHMDLAGWLAGQKGTCPNLKKK